MIKINLAPPTVGRRRAGLRLPSFNLGLLFGVLWLLGLLYVGWSWWERSAEEARLVADNQAKERELKVLKDKIGKGGNVKNDVAEMRKRVEVIENLTRDQSRPIRMFDAFADMIPRDLWITGFEDKGSVLKVNGTAFSPKAVADFMTNLRASGRFKEVDIVLSRQDPAKTPRLVTFEVTCRFES